MIYTLLANKDFIEISGASLERAKKILALPQSDYDLKALITFDNLKAMGFLPAAAGTRIPFKKFKDGFPIGEKRKADDDPNFADTSDTEEVLHVSPLNIGTNNKIIL